VIFVSTKTFLTLTVLIDFQVDMLSIAILYIKDRTSLQVM